MTEPKKCDGCGGPIDSPNKFDWPTELAGKVFCNECVRSKRYREAK